MLKPSGLGRRRRPNQTEESNGLTTRSRRIDRGDRISFKTSPWYTEHGARRTVAKSERKEIEIEICASFSVVVSPLVVPSVSFFDPERVLTRVEGGRIVNLRVGVGARVPWGGYVASN